MLLVYVAALSIYRAPLLNTANDADAETASESEVNRSTGPLMWIDGRGDELCKRVQGCAHVRSLLRSALQSVRAGLGFVPEWPCRLIAYQPWIAHCFHGSQGWHALHRTPCQTRSRLSCVGPGGVSP